MTALGLSAEQRAVVQHVGPLYVRACPGSGKTHTLVARALRLAAELPPARGLALLSFTNSATEEFKQRLVNARAAQLLKPPHFVGTIDSFLARFVVMPRGNPWAPNQPIQLVEDWRRYTLNAEIGRTANGKPDLRPLPLSAFAAEEVDLASRKVSLHLDFDRLSREKGPGLAKQIEAKGPQLARDAERAAAQLLHAMLARGVLSPTEVRLLAAAYLLSEGGSSAAHIENLVERFPKLVVDETQDCDAMLVKLLKRLAQAGVELTLIADPDQCIYAWRGADPAALARLADPWGKQPALSGNYRSTPNICRAASSLKHSASVDDSRGCNASSRSPIFVTPLKSSKPRAVGPLFLALLDEHRIGRSDAIVLAPTWSLARAIAGAEPSKATNQQLGAKLRASCSSARQRADPGSLKAVRELVDEFLQRRVAKGAFPWDSPAIADWMEAEARRLTCDLLLADPGKENWHDRTLAVLRTLRLPPGVGPSEASLRRCLPKPSQPLRADTEPESGLAFSTVHQAKGREYAAVLYAIGRRMDEKLKGLIADWSSRREASESRAVAYVGVTRAERLLLVAAPKKAFESTRDLLQRDGATVEVRR